MKRLWALVSYLFQDLFRSLTGMLVVVAALVFYLVAIVSVTGGIDRDYYALVIGGFFAVLAMVLAVMIADRAYQASSYLLILRLPSRMMFLAGVALTAMAVSALLQVGVALVSIPRLVTPLTAGMVLDILPVWAGWLVLGATLGLHMSELVRRGWSRTVLYALLAFILFSLNQQQSGVPVELADRFNWIPNVMPDPARWAWASRLVDAILWPLAAAVKVARAGDYGVVESLAPAALLLVAAFILVLAVALFERKDLILPES
jgi:hypothetical protein